MVCPRWYSLPGRTFRPTSVSRWAHLAARPGLAAVALPVVADAHRRGDDAVGLAALRAARAEQRLGIALSGRHVGAGVGRALGRRRRARRQQRKRRDAKDANFSPHACRILISRHRPQSAIGFGHARCPRPRRDPVVRRRRRPHPRAGAGQGNRRRDAQGGAPARSLVRPREHAAAALPEVGLRPHHHRRRGQGLRQGGARGSVAAGARHQVRAGDHHGRHRPADDHRRGGRSARLDAAVVRSNRPCPPRKPGPDKFGLR